MIWSSSYDLHRGSLEVTQWFGVNEGVYRTKISNLAEKQHYVISVCKTIGEALDFGMQSS